MALFSLQAQQDGVEVQFTVLDLLNLIDPTDAVNDEIIIRNKIFRRSSFKVLEQSINNNNSNTATVYREEKLNTVNGQTVFTGQIAITDPAKVKVVLNGLELQYGTDYRIQNAAIVCAYPVMKTNTVEDTIKLVHL